MLYLAYKKNGLAFMLVLMLGLLTPRLFASTLSLDSQQLESMGLETAVAVAVDEVPSAVFPAQATIPLKTIRSLSTPLAGQIVKLNYVHGPIKKGAVIAEIESPQLLQMQEDYLATLSDLSISQQNLKRARTLNKSGISSTKKLQQATSELKKLKLKKAQLKKNLILYGMAETAIAEMEKNRKLQPAILQIKSPIDGQLFDIEVRLGERVDKNQSIISLGETNPIILAVRVPVNQVNEVARMQNRVEILGMNKTGRILHIDQMVDPMTQSVDVHIEVENNQGLLRAGQLFKIRFMMQHQQQSFRVSANAISQYNGETVIFVKNDDQIGLLPIQVINITDGQLYFFPGKAFDQPLLVFVKGTAAIKAAMDANNDTEQE